MFMDLNLIGFDCKLKAPSINFYNESAVNIRSRIYSESPNTTKALDYLWPECNLHLKPYGITDLNRNSCSSFPLIYQ